jgi:hypothetical protein
VIKECSPPNPKLGISPVRLEAPKLSTSVEMACDRFLKRRSIAYLENQFPEIIKTHKRESLYEV